MLSIRDLKSSFGEHEVLKGIQLEASPGEIHGILGFNGAGKTTMFRTIYGYKKKDSGTVLYQNEPISNREIAFMETDTFFYSYMKGREYLELLAMRNPSYPMDQWNALFDLPLDDLIDTYSTGMRKKLAFLGIIALDRPIWILDEPFSGVDVESNEKIFQILQRLKSQNRVILISSHILQSFTTICDRISVLREGIITQTYDKANFPSLEEKLRVEIQQNIQGTLDDLMQQDQERLK